MLPPDVIAWTESQDASTLVRVAALGTGEDIFTVKDDGVYLMDRNPLLIGLATIYESDPGGFTEIEQGGIKVPYDFMTGGPDTGSEQRLAWLDWLNENPLPLIVRDYLFAKVLHKTNEQATVLAWVGFPYTPYRGPLTHRLHLRGTTTLTVDVWNDVTLTAQNTLPEGRYAVVGMQAWSHILAGAGTPIAARLKLPELQIRPGVLCDYGGYDSGNFGKAIPMKPCCRFPLDPRLSFRQDALPKAQFLSATADTEQSILLSLVQIAGTRNI